MKEYSIDCSGIQDEAALHTLLAEQLEFSPHYNHSFDALYDCLTAISQETRITVYGLGELSFSDRFRATLQDAETDNFWLSISLQ